MTGPEHYQRAESLLSMRPTSYPGVKQPPSAEDVARAQVHATLALAAATVLGTFDQSGTPLTSAWPGVSL